MSVRIGISPIAWQNDDLPDLTANFTIEQALQDARMIGYRGVERGQRMPADTEGLGRYLDANDPVLCGGWCSGNLLVHDVEAEIAAIRPAGREVRGAGCPLHRLFGMLQHRAGRSFDDGEPVPEAFPRRG